MSFSSLPVARFLDALASAEPAPGGGTASAMAGAMGTALLAMVAGLPKTRANSEDERAALARVGDELVPLRAAFEQCADRDTEAFNQVMAAYRLPKATDEDKGRRKTAIGAALRLATEVPLETLRLADRALELGETVARYGNMSAASDVGVAAGLLHAAGEGGAANVRTNLSGLSDEAFRLDAGAETERLCASLTGAMARLRAALLAG